jgi:hypothetical protein
VQARGQRRGRRVRVRGELRHGQRTQRRRGREGADGREVQLGAEPYLVAAAQRRWETAAVGG